MDPNAIAELLQSATQGGTIPPAPPTAPEMGVPQAVSSGVPEGTPPEGESQDFFPLLAEALDKLQNMGVPFVGDIVHLLTKGGGSVQSWKTLLKTIDDYGKHKDSVIADNIGNGQPNPQPPGSYQI
jgi:hypothetical protein